MLTKITNTLFIDLDEIYLVDGQTWEGSLLIYMRLHEKHPLELKDVATIDKFQSILTKYLTRKSKNEKTDEPKRRITEDVKSPGEVFLEKSIA